MADLKRDIQDDQGIKRMPTRGTSPEQPERSRTAGTDSDFDESRTSKNQGHGHPREERGAPAEEAGEPHVEE